MHGRNPKWTRAAATLAVALTALAFAPTAPAATREPLSVALAALRNPEAAMDASIRPDASALRAAQESRASRVDPGAGQVRISSTYYGPDQMAAIAADLEGLDHGPELAQLSVYVASPAEIVEICGTTVVACYVPSRMEMVVSGEDRAVAGVPRAFAIAHEYGHHIANTQRSDLMPAVEAGTIRWATYERVCQFTRSHHLFPGDQGAHYWEDPEEAFAESYAHLADPLDRISWQYTPLLQPTSASLAKIQADLSRPWTGPVSATLSGSVADPASVRPAHRVAGSAAAGIDSAVAVGGPPSIASRLVRTPLDGTVSVTVQAPAGADLAVSLRDPARRGTVVAGGITGVAGSAQLSYANCGHDALQLEVRSLRGAGTFTASVVKP